MWASNYPPDVPASSRIAIAIWASGGASVDGVLWTDAVWMAEMLRGTAPVTSAAWPEPITADNLVEVFHRGFFEIEARTRSMPRRPSSGATSSTPFSQAGRVQWRRGRHVVGARTGHLALFLAIRPISGRSTASV